MTIFSYGTKCLLFVGSVMLIAVPTVSAEDMPSLLDSYAEMTSFLGPFHPMVLHFPIGLLVGLFLLELLVLPSRDAQKADMGRWVMLALGASSAVVAAILGIFLSWSDSYDAHLLWEHKVTGVGVAVTSVLALLSRVGYSVTGNTRPLWGYRILLFASVILLLPAGHHGAALTHGTTYLTKNLPESFAFLAPILGESSKETMEVQGGTYFSDEILPILEAKCFECHGAEKQKGELRMDTLEDCLAGGESERPAIVLGKAMESYMMELILLPYEHEDVMPPSGKTALDIGEALTLAQWINRGAPWGDYTPPEPTVAEASGAKDLELTLMEWEVAPLVKTHEIMELFFESPVENLREGLRTEPKRRKQMRMVYNASFALGEAHNLLFSRNDEEYMSTPEWATLTVEGRDASNAIGESLKARDYEALLNHFDVLVESCNTCHDYFETDVDPVIAWPEPEDPEEGK